MRIQYESSTKMPDTMELDRADLALLAHLQTGGRLTNAELAERVNLSPSACLRRVQRLEREGVISGYGAHLDPKRIGLGLQAFVRLQLLHREPAQVEHFAELVNAWDEVVSCHALTGDVDYILHVAVADLDHFSRFLLDRLLREDCVANVNSSVVLRVVKAGRSLPLSAVRT